MRTNLFKSINFIRRGSGANLNLFRYATMVVVLLLGMSESAWGASYYSQFTAKSGNTAQGLVYAAGSNSEGGLSSYTNQVTPDKDDGSSGEEYTWYAWAKAARGYQFKTWTKGSNINSNGTLTNAATTFGVKHSSSDNGTTSGDATATFEAATAYTITYKKPENFGGYTAEYANYSISNNAFVDYTKTITMTSSSANTNETSYASDKVTLTATARVANFLGWYSGSKLLSTKADGYSFSPSEAMTIEGRWEDVTTHLNMTFKAVELDDSSNPKGYYTVGGTTVTTSDVVVNTGDIYYLETTLTATPAEGYVFTGWYTKEGKKRNFISYDNPFNAYFDQEMTVYANFSYNNYTDDQKAQFKVGSTPYTDLNAANAAAGSNGTIVCTRDGVLPPGNYTISSGVKLYIPYSSSESSQTTPAVVTTAAGLSVYRKLIMTEGATITVANGGVISVGGQIMSASGGSPSAYPTGACGVIDMSKGGHIELNNGATLYVWGFIKGQDMDQGNNTLDVGTITANSGSNIWEDFWLADWRGGSACACLAMNGGHMMFPFQGYTMQNIEVPTLYNYGATLNNYINVYGDKKTNAGTFATIGNENTLFLLKDAKSKVCKWYDPTTDLVCYELTGTTQIDALNVDAGITEVSSAGFNLPITSNMHVILNSDITISKPITILPGAVLEVKSGYTATISDNIYMYDTDDWGKGVLGYYFYPFSNLTSHKSRGTGSVNDLEDAKLVVDGTLTITGKIYSTTGGSNIMGNGGGKVTLPSVLYGSPCLYQAWGGASGTKTSTTRTLSYWAASSDTYVEPITVNSANLYNEDGSYTQSAASTTFHNVNGRWFAASAKDEKANHTYDFTYISSGAVSGAGGTNTTTDAVYSNDKTGMEARMKWANVTADACADWWHGQGVQAGWFYNWTMNSAWHQFQSTETEGLYSGSNNKIYTKTDCNWEELGETDVNCLYTIDVKKKALVDGHFIELEPNNNDPAYHAADDATQYYICFEGCNWHEATKIEGEKKAYAINEDNFIWYEDRWMQAEREIPFFYTYDETNVKVYYEYIGSEWVLAQPYVEVTDAIETRQLLTFSEALTVASAKKNATIKILRDIPNVITSGVYTGAGQACTLDLNGHIVTSSCQNLLTVNAKSGTLTILDNTTDKKGELRACPFANARTTGFTVTAGTLVLQSGKMYSTNSATRTGSTAATYKDATNTGIVVAGTFNVTGGILESEDEHQNYGAQVSGTVNLSAGKIIAKTTKWYSTRGVYLAYGKLNISGTGALEVTAAGSDAVYGVYVHATASYNASKNTTSKSAGTLTMSGGSINAQSGKNAYAVYVNRAVAVASTTDRTIKADALGVMTMSGGTIEAVATSSTNARGVYSYGTVTISGGSITATAKANTTAYGILTYHGVTTIKGTANIMANATGTAYGVLASGDINGTYGYLHKSDVKIENGTIKANATTGNTAYAVYVTGTTKTVANAESAAQKVFNGDYAAAGSATITTGTFEANAKGTTAAGIFVNSEAAVTKGDASDIPTCTVNGGYYKMTGSSAVTGCNNAAAPANFHINGGYYSHNGNLATYAASPKHVLTLASGDANRPPYYYKVAEAYQVTFKTEDGTANIIDPIYQEVNTKPVCSTEPTKASTSTNSFTFDGWATAANGDKVYEKNGLPNVTSAGATYYAHFATTTLKYRVHFDAATNGGDCATENIYVDPGTAVGTLPTATKYGYTFSGWFTAASGGTKLEATTVINANADYYAQFTVNSHTLTWDLAGGAVGTAGKIGSTTWPAKNATGTQSRSVAYGTVLTTIPVVTKAGYVFNRWDPVPTSSMPDNDVTYTALWNPATNTKYYVKHYQQNIDDDNYTLEETDNLTGTTGATVTPDRKSYDGFLTPTPQQLTIGAAGTSELVYNYDRVVYTINWNASANGGMCAMASTDVRHGATLSSVPDATKAGYALEGWYTKAEGGNKISEGATILQNYGTLYAQFVPTYTIIWNDENGNELSREEKLIGESLTPPDYSKEDTQEWDYTFHGWNDGTTTYAANAIPAVSGAATYTADVTKVKNNYTLTIGVVEAGYGSVNETSVTVPYGTSVSTSDNVLTIGTTTVTATPTASNAQYTYTFSTWQNVPTSVTGNVDNIQAVFTRTLNTVTVTWKNGDDVIETDEGVVIGTTPTFNGETPIKETDENFGYTFDGWDDGTTVYAADALPTVSGAVTYTATYSTVPTVASVTVGGATTYYNTIDAAFDYMNLQTSNTELKLLQDVTATDSLVYTPAAAITCTLDLNNHILSGSMAKLFVINLAGSTFVVTDKSAEKEGKILNNYNYNIRVYAVVHRAGTFKLQAGTIRAVNPHKYSSAAANKNSAATGIYFTNGYTFTMDGGKIESECQYASYGLQCKKGTSTVTINNGEISARTTASTTAYGIYTQAKGLTINNGTIKSFAKTSKSYAVYLNGGTATINGGYIEAANDTVSGGTTSVYGIYALYSTTTYTGKLTIPSTSTVKVKAVANTTTAVAVFTGGGGATKYASVIQAGEFIAYTKTGKTAYGVYNQGHVKVSDGKFKVTSATTDAYGIICNRGTATVSGTPEFTVKATTSTAVGVLASGLIPSKGGTSYSGNIEVNGGKFNVSTGTSTSAMGAYASVATKSIWTTTSDSVPGNYAYAGTMTITAGEFNVTSYGSTSYALICKASATQNKNTELDPMTATPKLTVTGGKFILQSNNGGNTTCYASNDVADAEDLLIQGGYYSSQAISSTQNLGDKYTAPMKDCNYHSLQLTAEECTAQGMPANSYEVAEACTITFKNGEADLQSGLVKKGATPVYAGETPTKTADAQYTYTFDGWSATEGGDKLTSLLVVEEDATYFAHYTSTVNNYTVSIAANNAEWGTVSSASVADVPYGSAVTVNGNKITVNGTTITATPAEKTAQYTYAFDHWENVPETVTGNVANIQAVFNRTLRSYSVTWDNYGGETLETDDDVPYGTIPEYNRETPTRDDNPEYKYTFTGWSDGEHEYAPNDLPNVTGDVTYTAIYTSEKKKYTITWMDNQEILSEHVIAVEEYEYGQTPSYTYNKPSDESYSYVVTGWTPDIVPVTEDAIYVAQYNAIPKNMEVVNEVTIPSDVEVVTTTVKVSGHLTINEGAQLTTDDLILEASGEGSGDIDGADRVQLKAGGKAYFDYNFNTDPWHWSAFGVPFVIDLDEHKPLKGTTELRLGVDYDIVYYNSQERAAHGPSGKCWKYVEYDAERKLTPGKLYMIAFNRSVGHVYVVRFTKAAEAAIDFTANVALTTTGTGNDNNWNGIANPRMYHALLDAGVTECQVHDGGEIGKDGYYTYDMQDRKFFVGKAAFVQVPNEQSVMTTTQATNQSAIVAKAPRRAKAQEGADRYDVQIAPMAEEMSDRVFLLTDEDKADEYVIVSDLAKAGVSPVRPQMWVNRYGVKLCKNTVAMRENIADYPLGISVPADGSYDIFLEERPNNDDMLYLTYDGEAIWNLSYGACTIDLQRGTTDHYGLRVVAKTPQVATGIEEATIQNGDAVRKVIVEDKVFIIRNGQIFGIDGRLAK